jgi:uncharacterized membrane protein
MGRPTMCAVVSICCFITAVLIGFVGFWLVQSAGAIEDITVIKVAKVVIGTALIIFTYFAIHASLDIHYFGRVYWDHLI